MIDTAYVRFTEYGITGLSKRPPKLRAGEFAVQLRLEVPEEQFDRIFPLAIIQVPESGMILPDVEIVTQNEEE